MSAVVMRAGAVLVGHRQGAHGAEVPEPRFAASEALLVSGWRPACAARTTAAKSAGLARPTE